MLNELDTEGVNKDNSPCKHNHYQGDTMTALELIAQAIKADGAQIVEFDLNGFLEIDYADDVSFIVSDQIVEDGYLAATAFAGRDRETNGHTDEYEFTATDPTTMADTISKIAKEFADRYAD